MILRVERKETENYNTNDERHIEFDILKKDGVTFGEILTKIKLLKKKNSKRKRRLIIKRYKSSKHDFIYNVSNIKLRKTNKRDENEFIEDMYLYNEYLSSDESITTVRSNEFKEWKKKHNNYFFPSLDAPWQVRRIFRIMENSLGDSEKEQFLKLKFELWIYVNKPIALQEKILDIIYGKRKHKNYDKLVMGDLINIIKNLKSVNGYIRLIDYMAEKREKMYMGERDYNIEMDINILASIKKELNNYLSNGLINDEIKKLKLKMPNIIKKAYW